MKSNMFMVIVLLLCGTTAEDTGWPKFQHDPQHSGYSSSPMPESLREVWVNESFVGDGDFNLSFAIIGETLFVSRYSSLCALDINTGSSRKNYQTISAFGFPAIEDGRLCLNVDFSVRCLDIDSGEKLWSHVESLLTFVSYPIIVNGLVFVGGGYPHHPAGFDEKSIEATMHAERMACRVMCVDAETGEIIWEFYANDFTTDSPAYFDGKVYINDDKEAFCLDAQTGEIIWHKEIGWTSFSSLSLDGERIFIGTYWGLVCLDMETGEVLWRFQCDSSVERTPATAYGYVFASSGKILYCFAAESGKLKWKREVESPITTELVVADGKVAFGTADSMLYIVKARSGKVCESLGIGDSPVIALALSNGKLIVGEEDGRITCFEGTPRPLTEYILVSTLSVVATALLIVAVLWYRTKGKEGRLLCPSRQRFLTGMGGCSLMYSWRVNR